MPGGGRFSCRRNQPSLVDANRAPETELWYAPADSSDYEYRVHLYWRGIDADGVALRYIWTITDTLLPPGLDWDPSTRVRDFRSGRITSRNDSVFAFTAFRNVGGVGIKKNIQTFHIASIDDNGVIDPSPARIEFVATVEKLPFLRFTTQVGSDPQKLYDPNHIDTVGMFRPFRISYKGTTQNGVLNGYRFFPLSSGVILEGENEWNEDVTDTLRIFPNAYGVDAVPSGELKLAVRCRDESAAESRIDGAKWTEGVARIVVNFEPQTVIDSVLNTYFLGQTAFRETVRFGPGVVPANTVPFRSWVRLSYDGSDDSRDVSRCTEGRAECIRYQIQYTRVGDQDGGPSNGGSHIESTVRWLPDTPENSNAPTTARWDSTSMNVGTEAYTIRVRSVDEYGKPDGTPAEMKVVGNFKPTLDAHTLENYDGTVIGPGDTLRWDWWNPANYKGSLIDTLDISNPLDLHAFKEFYFVVKATGHDHPKEPVGSGVKSWLYTFRDADNPLIIAKFARSGVWTDAPVTNALSDTFRVAFRYSLRDDPGGQMALTPLPTYLDRSYTYSVRGRDLSSSERFDQVVYLLGQPVVQNGFNVSTIGRWTGLRGHGFYLKLDH